MSLIKNDVTDKDIENLFDNNDTKGFSESEQSEQESIIPAELDVNSDSQSKIERPDDYQVEEVRQKKIDAKKKEALLKSQSREELLQTRGNVSKDVFQEVAKVRQQAQLEEFVSKQRKLPKIDPSARYKLYGADPKCNFHVYQPIHTMEGGRFLCSCKFCSEEKIFTEQQWKNYELENRQFM